MQAKIAAGVRASAALRRAVSDVQDDEEVSSAVGEHEAAHSAKRPYKARKRSQRGRRSTVAALSDDVDGSAEEDGGMAIAAAASDESLFSAAVLGDIHTAGHEALPAYSIIERVGTEDAVQWPTPLSSGRSSDRRRRQARMTPPWSWVDRMKT